MFFGSLSSMNPLECVSMNNQECKVRPEIVNVNSNDTLFYPFSISASKCSGICNNTNDPYAKLCVPHVVKNLNIKLFNLMPRTNETRHIKWHETSKCKCRLDASVCNNKQRWNEDKCRLDVNAKNSLIKVYVIKGLFVILVILNVNAINLVTLVSIWVIKIVNVEKSYMINLLKNLLKILMKEK